MKLSRLHVLGIAGLIALLGCTWLVYAPGLKGPFLFDDYANLPALGAQGPIDNGASLARYLTSGTADPTGRPVALASFLIDARDWPADPEPFKRTNVLLHLANGALLYWLLLCLGRSATAGATTSPGATVAALLGSGMWLLHPLFVSTTLYIVQREAMLPCTFALLGLLGWWHGRKQIKQGHVTKGIALGWGAIAVSTLLGVLSKANGALLPVLVLVVEYGLLANEGWRFATPLPVQDGRTYLRGVLAWCWVAAFTIGLYLFWFVVRSLHENVAPSRSWTLGQRLLTEPRVLWDYVRLLWFPRPYTAGVFNDQLEASQSLLTPWSTLPALLGIVAVLGGAVLFRRRAPALCTAILFFLAGHAIESTSVPLELYFEHRNYLPAILMFWPLGLFLSNPESITSRCGRSLRLIAGTGVLILLAGFTLLNATIWGDERNQALLWAHLNPRSNRAQANAASTEIFRGEPAAAERRLRPLLAAQPGEVQLAFNLVAARCAQGEVSHSDLRVAEEAISSTRDPGTLFLGWFSRASDIASSGTCRGFDNKALRDLLVAGLRNGSLPPGRRQDLMHLTGSLYLREGDGMRAHQAFDRALELDPRLPTAMEQAAELGSHGFAALGLQHLARFDTLALATHESGIGMPVLHDWVLERQHYWANERASLETTLRQDAANTTLSGAAH